MTGGHVDPHYARSDRYRQDLEEISAAEVCPFCPQNFRWHPNPVLHRSGGWLITEIREKYPNAELHFLLIGDRHTEHITDLGAGDWSAVSELISWANSKYGIEGGGLAIRFGPTRMTGASVTHLHMHLIKSEIDTTTGRAKVVSFPFG